MAQQRATQALSSIEDVNNWLGRSQYSADAYYTGLMHEFRIYNAVLSSPQVMANAAAGPEDDFAQPGALLALRLAAPPSVLSSRHRASEGLCGVPEGGQM